MPFENNLLLKDINPEWAEKWSGYRNIAKVPICLVSVVSSYDAEPINSNSFSISLNLYSTPVLEITKSINKIEYEVTEKKFKKQD